MAKAALDGSDPKIMFYKKSSVGTAAYCEKANSIAYFYYAMKEYDSSQFYFLDRHYIFIFILFFKKAKTIIILIKVIYLIFSYFLLRNWF